MKHLRQLADAVCYKFQSCLIHETFKFGENGDIKARFEPILSTITLNVPANIAINPVRAKEMARLFT